MIAQNLSLRGPRTAHGNPSDRKLHGADHSSEEVSVSRLVERVRDFRHVWMAAKQTDRKFNDPVANLLLEGFGIWPGSAPDDLQFGRREASGYLRDT
ncbi:hypothetical protein GOB92_33570 [Sinorhizobium meliloti]|nr:hypothetical protein [Sinorhizobium meliloti]